MAPDADRFMASTSRMFRHYVDEIWGPYRGPGGPHMLGALQQLPPPVPWRELDVAHQFVGLADVLELTAEGAGVLLLKEFADDPEFTCGTRPPGRPRPPKKGEPYLDLATLGAALVFVADGAGHEAVARTAREIGRGMTA